jgi:hypothetical protein
MSQSSLQPAEAGLQRGAIVLLTLGSPREKFWGALLELTLTGVTARGIDLNSFQDFTTLLKSGEAVHPAVVFFPMHRVERIELDASSAGVPSLAEQFLSKSGRDALDILLPAGGAA